MEEATNLEQKLFVFQNSVGIVVSSLQVIMT